MCGRGLRVNIRQLDSNFLIYIGVKRKIMTESLTVSAVPFFTLLASGGLINMDSKQSSKSIDMLSKEHFDRFYNAI